MAIAASCDWISDADTDSRTSDDNDTGASVDRLSLVRLLVMRPDDDDLYIAVQDRLRANEARQAFQDLFQASLSEQEERAASMIATFSPAAICAAARSEFREKGNQDRMLLLVRLLREAGPEAISALDAVVSECSGDVEYFVELIAEFSTTDRDARKLLRSLSEHPAQDIRHRVLATIPDLPREIGHGLLDAFLRDADISVAQEAGEVKQRMDAQLH